MEDRLFGQVVLVVLEPDLFRAAEGSGAPVNGAVHDVAHAGEPPSGGDAGRVAGDAGRRRAAGRAVEAEFQLIVDINI